MNRAEWLEERRKGIGASDVGAILGISPYQTPLGLYLEKRGEIGTEPGSDETDFGRRFEEFVLKEFEARTGKDVIRYGYNSVVNAVHPWMRATPDGAVADEFSLVEAKTANIFKRSEWEDGPPMYIEAQCQHQMAVMGPRWRKTYVPVYFAGREFEIFEVRRDDELINDLIRIEHEFWDRVVDGNPPDVTSQDVDVLKRWFPSAIEKSVGLTPAHFEMVKRCVELGPIIKSYEDELSYLKAQLMRELGDADAGLFDDERVVTWKEQGRKSVDAKALKEELPEIYQRYEKESRFRVMRFHWKGEDE